MTDREILQALLDGKEVENKDATINYSYKLDSDGRLVEYQNGDGYLTSVLKLLKLSIKEPPPIKLGPEHVGKRVRLRNGIITVITSWVHIDYLTTAHTKLGYDRKGIHIFDSTHDNSALDIVEILD